MAKNGTDVPHWTEREIRALRHAMRMSVRAFADHLGFSDRMVSKCETGGSAVLPRPLTQQILDTALKFAPAEALARYGGWPTRTQLKDDGDPGWVVHIPVDVPNLAAALNVAQAIMDALASVLPVDGGETAVSPTTNSPPRVSSTTRTSPCARVLQPGPPGSTCGGHWVVGTPRCSHRQPRTIRYGRRTRPLIAIC